jgi:hypothetical protein
LTVGGSAITAVTSGSFAATVALPGGSAWNLTGAVLIAQYVRVGSLVIVCGQVQFPNGTSIGGAYLGVSLTALPIPVVSVVAGTMTAYTDFTADANRPIGIGSRTAAVGANRIDLNCFRTGGAVAAGTAIDCTLNFTLSYLA